MGPWNLGRWYRPLAIASAGGCTGLILVGIQPPNQKAAWVVAGYGLALAVVWFALARHRFPGPPLATLNSARRDSEMLNQSA
jgi:hypothetical protein